MLTEDIDYDLPGERIARFPTKAREDARLLVVSRTTGTIADLFMKDFPHFFKQPDLLLLNNTKVIPARLLGRSPNGREFEILLISKTETAMEWACLVRPGRKIVRSTAMILSDGTPVSVFRTTNGFVTRFPEKEEFFSWLESVGEIPIPPYLNRPPVADDRERYQTVFAKTAGAVAAPTAGLHFSEELLETIRRSVKICEITLHIGYGTFAPVSSDSLATGQLHPESYKVPVETMTAIEDAKRQGGRIVCIGTTSVRAIESVPTLGYQGRTRLFIRPGYHFRTVDALLTNFHLPGTSLILLVSAFLGKDRTRACYEHAIKQGYRFYSYGDAMLII